LRRLDFLVPHWKETPEEMEPLLDTIKAQRSVDLSQVGVVIAYDGPDAAPLPVGEWAERYPFAIEHVVTERKGGVSATRNAALDASEAEYVMFADADDCMMDVRGLHIVFSEMEIDPDPQAVLMAGGDPSEAGKGFDFIFSDFMEETRDRDGNVKYMPHVGNMTFVHGQVARRQWLVDNDLRFNESIQVHEDSYWVCLCRNVVKPWRGRVCPVPWFLWCWRDGSVCRSDPEYYILKTYPSMLRSNQALVEQLIMRSLPERAAEMFVSMCLDSYYTMNKREWMDVGNQGFRDEVEGTFARYFRKYRSLWDGMPMQQKTMISQMVRQRSVLEGMLLEALTVDQWLEAVLRKHPLE